MINRKGWRGVLLDTVTGAVVLGLSSYFMPRTLFQVADINVMLVLLGLFIVWSGLRSPRLVELCLRAVVFCGAVASILVVSLIWARLQDTGYISHRVRVAILSTYMMGATCCVVFIALGFIPLTLRNMYVRRRAAQQAVAPDDPAAGAL